MNKEEKKMVNKIREDLETQTTQLEELSGTIADRISNLEDSFPNGNPTIEKLQEQADSIDNAVSSLQEAVSSLEEMN